MSVYTALTRKDFSEILTLYSLGELTHFEGIQAGVENTNYFLSSTKGDYVFTLFEKINKDDLDFYISLLQKLSQAGMACPQPQYDLRQQTINEIHRKPFAIVNRLQGDNPGTISAAHCKAIAQELAKLHSLPLRFSKQIANRRGKTWREATTHQLLDKISGHDADLITSELALYRSLDESVLPKGIIHADLFRDNALFVNEKLSGIIDFYDACYDTLLLDVAITVNDWCINESGKIDQNRYSVFLTEYQAIRPFTATEQSQWGIMLRLAATRFWLSRLQMYYYPPRGKITHIKNPDIFKNILLCHIQHANKDH